MKTVIVVDNNKELHELIKNALNEIPGIRVIQTAEDGEEGILKIHNLKPDIVITDIKMPKVDGTELIKYIAKDWMNYYIPHFIVITSQDAQSSIKLRDLPVRRILNKPFSVEDLVNEVIKIQKEERISVLIADDDKEYCEKLKNGLSRYEDIDILGFASTYEEEVSLIEDLNPDIVITDLIRKNKFTGKEIIEKYIEDDKKMKFFVISYTPFCVEPSTHKNVVGCMQKYEIETKLDDLVYKLRKFKANSVRLKIDEDILSNKQQIKVEEERGIFRKVKLFFTN